MVNKKPAVPFGAAGLIFDKLCHLIGAIHPPQHFRPFEAVSV